MAKKIKRKITRNLPGYVYKLFGNYFNRPSMVKTKKKTEYTFVILY